MALTSSPSHQGAHKHPLPASAWASHRNEPHFLLYKIGSSSFPYIAHLAVPGTEREAEKPTPSCLQLLPPLLGSPARGTSGEEWWLRSFLFNHLPFPRCSPWGWSGMLIPSCLPTLVGAYDGTGFYYFFGYRPLMLRHIIIRRNAHYYPSIFRDINSTTTTNNTDLV